MELTTACRYFSCSKLLESVWAWPEKGEGEAAAAGDGDGQAGLADTGRTKEEYLEKVYSGP